MNSELQALMKRLDALAFAGTSVIPWSCPVPSFGDLQSARIATLGLNPSNREFVDVAGNELDGPHRRFHTLRSLELDRWSSARTRHVHLVVESCRQYFTRNPYDGWFKKLDYILSGTRASYYGGRNARACHLDLIPYATARKWTTLAPQERTSLLSLAGDTLGLLLRNSPVRVLVLNGHSVVENFQALAGVHLDKTAMLDWSLPRRSGSGVIGFAYEGVVNVFSGTKLKREILVLGFNHNIQSSFGVTTHVTKAIRSWINRRTGGVLL
jgi:hypothetical protein